MDILLTNDDGILAPGLMALFRRFAARHQVHVVAPESVQSGGSHAITIRHPVFWRTVQVDGVLRGTSVDGSPADCVKLAINELLPGKPDLVLSGINSGSNTGVHVIYSGTVAAAIEGAILGCPAIAVSLKLYRDMDFDRAAEVAERLIDVVWAQGLSPRDVVNINLPELKPGWPLGVKVVPQSVRAVADKIEKRRDPSGREYYWLTGDFLELDDGLETDLHALHEGYATVTPLHFNLTRRDRLEAMRDWSWPGIGPG